MAEGELVIKTVLDLSGSEQIVRRQVENALGGRESAETRHQRRIEALTLQHANRLQQIESRKQAQIDAIRERGMQRELEHQRKIERETQRAANAFGSMRAAIAGVAGIFSALAASGAIRFFEDLARRAIDAAIAIDRQVNTLKALTGSAEAARARFAELFAIAQRSPGLTTSLAATLDAQLRIFDVSVRTIDRLLPVIGRLNAISPLGDPRQFVNNLTQLVTQNFERQDLKELVGASPIAGKLIKEIFDVDNPTNAEAIRAAARRLGITTVERLAEEFVKAGETNSALKNATETFAGQFEKLQERITVAIAPIGDELLKTILPAFNDLVEILERDGPKITGILQDNKEALLAVAGAFVTAANAAGQLIQAFSILDQQFGIIRGLSVLLVGAVNPGAAAMLPDLFRQADANAPIVGRFESAIRPTGEQLRQRALAEGDMRGLVRANQIIAQEEALKPPPDGGLGGGGELSRAAKERANQIAELKKKIFGEIDKITQRAVDDLSEVERALTGEILGNIQREGDRPNQRRRRAALIGAIIERDEAETLRLEQNTRRQEVEDIQRAARRGLSRSGASIGDLVNRGAITPGEAEALGFAANRDFADRLRVARELVEQQVKLGEATQAQVELLQDEIELYDRLGTAISDNERFMRGFNSQIESSSDIWERFGQNVSNAFRNVRDLFNGLKSAVLGFFNDLLGNSIQNLLRATIGPLFSGGGLGSLFRTPSFAGGGGISAPQSISGVGSIVSGLFNRGGGGAAGGVGDFVGAGVPRVAGSIASAASGFSFGNIASSVSSILPLIGTQLGAGLGGQSVPGQLLGAAGGSGLLGAILGPFALVGAALLGGGKQRRADEQASGELLTQALQAIQQLASGIASDQIDGSQARSIFDSQILGTFKSGIGQLKTKSVRDSRLTNQVRDLEKVYNDVVPPQIAAQQTRRLTSQQNALNFSRQIPEFATGGTTRGGIALLHPGEKVLNAQQQAAVIRQSNPRVFDNAGVPGPSQNRVFDIGGTMGSRGLDVPIEITLDAQIVIGKDDASKIFVVGANSPRGRQVTVNNIKVAQTDREL